MPSVNSEGVQAPMKWSIPIIAAGFWLAGVLSMTVAQAVSSVGSDVPAIVVFFAAQSAFWSVLIATAIWSSRRHGRGQFRKDFGISAQRSDAVYGLALGAACQLIGVAVIYAFIGIIFKNLDVSAPAQEVVSRFGAGGDLAILAVGLVVVGPFVEEVFFRGLVFSALRERYGDSVAIWGSAIAFGLSHFQVIQAPALIAFGLLLAILVRNTGRLGLAYFTHAGFNAATVIVMFVSR